MIQATRSLRRLTSSPFSSHAPILPAAAIRFSSSTPLASATPSASSSAAFPAGGVQPGSRRGFSHPPKEPDVKNPSACQVPVPPFPTAIIYNQSRHASSSVLADIRAVWGARVRVFQTIEEGDPILRDANQGIYIKKGHWGDMEHFKARLDGVMTREPKLAAQIAQKKVVFMPGWSAFAESSETAVKVNDLGLVWPGTEPGASERLEKIGFKRLCESVGAPTPAFCVISEEDCQRVNLQNAAARAAFVEMATDKVLGMKTNRPGLIKSIHGGGGKGTAHLNDPSDKTQVQAAINKVLNEMNRVDGIYFEQKVNQDGDGRFFQLELEVDGDVVSHGGRFVWFNSRLQKVVEIGLSDDLVTKFMPLKLYQQAREWSSAIAKKAGNNTRATMEALVFKNKSGETEMSFIECNRRPQVENEALALLQQDTNGNRRYTFAELMMRAAGYETPDFGPSSSCQVVLHARWLHGNPDSEGNIAYQAGKVAGMRGPRLDWVASELLAPGEISFTADPQLGKAVIIASTWEQMCERAATYFSLRRPDIQGPASTYGALMQQMFTSPEFVAGNVASNETFRFLKIPLYPPRTLAAVLEEQIAPVLVNGYRPGEGVDPERWPTSTVCDNVMGLQRSLAQQVPLETAFTRYTRGELTRAAYITELRGQLSNQGGGWVTVAPRDTAQQGNDSESAGINDLSRRNAEVWAQRAGCVGYETGGAQYQAALIRGFNPALVMRLGLPYNMPAHSLQRSQYVNGLAELTANVREPLFMAMSDMVDNYYGRLRDDDYVPVDVPWFPYNFHAGNYCDANGYSPQDETTGEMLDAGHMPLPCWVFSPHFSLEQLRKWTDRQLKLFESKGQVLDMIRIKNPGQGLEWVSDTVWAHIVVIRQAFKDFYGGKREPIIYIHNHDFNGLGAHTGKKLLKMAHQDGYSFLVIDGAYRKNNTHNDVSVLLSELNFCPETKEALVEYSYVQQMIEQVLSRFDSRTSQMTAWNSDWAGGTEGSDLRIAKEYDLDSRQINTAKMVASAVFPLERAVTPFSEYKLRLGIALMIEQSIFPKTPEAVVKYIEAGGKLKVGGDVLVGLERWHTLVQKPPIVQKLLDNMAVELKAALGANAKLLTMADLGDTATPDQIYTVLGYQQKGFDFLKVQGTGKGDLTPLLLAPHVLHRKPRTLMPGTNLKIILDDEETKVHFVGFGRAPNGDITVGFQSSGQDFMTHVPDPEAVAAATSTGPRKANPHNEHEYGAVVPGEVLSYQVKVGDVLKQGDPMVVLESMKMEMKLSVPQELHGMVVKSLPCRIRTKEQHGLILRPGDLLLEAEPAKK
eukprot:gb/GEZN01000524.1/.p1 GENE.gb/GEZN01000524.1/~~gb/GEZN01000524.1/.p1  ORF type:complete len:1311 (-),score=232.99 gb/GEZN01000524.1/:105-4037(-)